MLKPDTLAKIANCTAFVHGDGFAGRLSIAQVWGEGLFVGHETPVFAPGAQVTVRLPPEVQTPPLKLTCEVLQVVPGPPAQAGYALKIIEAKGEVRPSIEAMKAKRRVRSDPESSAPPVSPRLRSSATAARSRPKSAAPRIRQKSAAPRIRPKRAVIAPNVLVVEDDRASAKLVSVWLESDGYRPVAVGTGAEAEAAVVEHSASLTVMIIDSLLPDIVGKELIVKLKAHAPDAFVFSMSGVFNSESAQRDVRRAGADEFLHKPLAEDSFRSMVRWAFDQKKQRRAG